MQKSFIDIEYKAKELNFDYHFLVIAIETFLMYKKGEDKRKEVWDKVVWLQYFNMNVANFKRYENNLDALSGALRDTVENSFQPLDLNAVDENNRATLVSFARGEELKLYHLFALQSATNIYFDFKKKYNNMLIMDFVYLHFGEVHGLFDKDNYTN
ncbi:MAG: hypothetical protein ACTHOF_12540 [Flavisolibacter sp.]